MDLSQWMSRLDESLARAPLVRLAIPGTHDSLSYTIKKDSHVSPDINIPGLRLLEKIFGPLVRRFVYNWSVTQSLSVPQQLSYGIRYFDLRIAPKGKLGELYVVHGLYGGPIKPPLIEMAQFLRENEGEVIVVDVQHLYKFRERDHAHLRSILIQVFQDLLCPPPADVSSLTLHHMVSTNCRVIVVYRGGKCSVEEPLWNGRLIPTPWPDTMSPVQLVSCLEDGLGQRSLSRGYVSQCVLTPTRTTVLTSPCSDLRKKCAKPAERLVIPWLNGLQWGERRLNIAISDFVEENDGVFPRAVVALNSPSDG